MRKKKRPGYIRLVIAIYRELVVDKYKDQNFWILMGFIPALIAARIVVYLSPNVFLSVGSHHVHHFTYGIIILGISGFIAVNRPAKSPKWLAWLYGVGLALALDETGMWVYLTNQYYNNTSENVIIFAIVLLINMVYFREFWVRLLKESYYLFTKR